METTLHIDNEARSAGEQARFERRSPASGEVVTTSAAASSSDAIAAIEAADRAFASWSQTGPGARRTRTEAERERVMEREREEPEAEATARTPSRPSSSSAT